MLICADWPAYRRIGLHSPHRFTSRGGRSHHSVGLPRWRVARYYACVARRAFARRERHGAADDDARPLALIHDECFLEDDVEIIAVGAERHDALRHAITFAWRRARDFDTYYLLHVQRAEGAFHFAIFSPQEDTFYVRRCCKARRHFATGPGQPPRRWPKTCISSAMRSCAGSPPFYTRLYRPLVCSRERTTRCRRRRLSARPQRSRAILALKGASCRRAADIRGERDRCGRASLAHAKYEGMFFLRDATKSVPPLGAAQMILVSRDCRPRQLV